MLAAGRLASPDRFTIIKRNKLDEACQQHDIAYATSSDVRGRNKADDVLANKASQIVMESDTPDYEKQDARLVTGIIATKSRFGM